MFSLAGVWLQSCVTGEGAGDLYMRHTRETPRSAAEVNKHSTDLQHEEFAVVRAINSPSCCRPVRAVRGGRVYPRKSRAKPGAVGLILPDTAIDSRMTHRTAARGGATEGPRDSGRRYPTELENRRIA